MNEKISVLKKSFKENKQYIYSSSDKKEKEERKSYIQTINS